MICLLFCIFVVMVLGWVLCLKFWQFLFTFHNLYMIENNQNKAKQMLPPFDIVYNYRLNYKTPIKGAKKAPSPKQKNQKAKSNYENEPEQEIQLQKQSQLYKKIEIKRRMTENLLYDNQFNLQEQVSGQNYLLSSQPNIIINTNQQLEEASQKQDIVNQELLWAGSDLEKIIPVELREQELDQQLLLQMTSFKNNNKQEIRSFFNKKI